METKVIQVYYRSQPARDVAPSLYFERIEVPADMTIEHLIKAMRLNSVSVMHGNEADRQELTRGNLEPDQAYFLRSSTLYKLNTDMRRSYPKRSTIPRCLEEHIMDTIKR